MLFKNKSTARHRQDSTKNTFGLKLTERGNTLVVDYNPALIRSRSAKDHPRNPLQESFLEKAGEFRGPEFSAVIDGKLCRYSAGNGNEKTGKAVLVTSTYPGSVPIVTKEGKVLADGFVGTCAEGVPCEGNCYAIDLLKTARPNSIPGLVQNTMLLRNHYNQEFEDFIVDKAKHFAAVRFNAFGDFVDAEHLISSIRIAERLGEHGTFCLAFTKKYDLVREVLALGERFPENYTLLLSTWIPDFMPDKSLARQFPLAIYVPDWEEAKRFGDANICTGDCCECGRCIGLGKDEYIVLIEHDYKSNWRSKSAQDRHNPHFGDDVRARYRRNLSENYGLTPSKSRKHRGLFRSRNTETEGEWTDEQATEFYEMLKSRPVPTFEDFVFELHQRYRTDADIVADAVRNHGPCRDKAELIEITRRFVGGLAFEFGLTYDRDVFCFVRYGSIDFVNEYIQSRGF